MLDGQAIVNAEDAAHSIKSGMSDQALMEKYELSPKGLQSLFRKLVAAGAIEQSVLDQRKSYRSRTKRLLSLRNRHRPTNIQGEDAEFTVPSPAARWTWKTHKHYFWAVGGALVGGLAVFAGMIFFSGFGSAKSNYSATVVTPTAAVTSGEREQTEQLISILESIANDPQQKTAFDALGKASDYDDCLSRCKNDFQHAEPSDKALVANCRRECIAQYAERVKAIRKRFYNITDED